MQLFVGHVELTGSPGAPPRVFS